MVVGEPKACAPAAHGVPAVCGPSKALDMDSVRLRRRGGRKCAGVEGGGRTAHFCRSKHLHVDGPAASCHSHSSRAPMLTVPSAWRTNRLSLLHESSIVDLLWARKQTARLLETNASLGSLQQHGRMHRRRLTEFYIGHSSCYLALRSVPCPATHLLSSNNSVTNGQRAPQGFPAASCGQAQPRGRQRRFHTFVQATRQVALRNVTGNNDGLSDSLAASVRQQFVVGLTSEVAHGWTET